MHTQLLLTGLADVVRSFRFSKSPCEYRVQALRECPTPEAMQQCDTPDHAVTYWRIHIDTHPLFNPEAECMAVLLLNTRHRIKGHNIVSVGILDTVLCHAREVFRLAVATAAHSIVLMHNHPSGESTPSDADIRVTRDIIRAGAVLKVEVLDHVIVGNGTRTSLKELGHFYH